MKKEMKEKKKERRRNRGRRKDLPPLFSIPPLEVCKLELLDFSPVLDLEPVDPRGRGAHLGHKVLELGQGPRGRALRDALDAASRGVPHPAHDDRKLSGLRPRPVVDLVGLVGHVLPEVDALDPAKDLEVEGKIGGRRRRRRGCSGGRRRRTRRGRGSHCRRLSRGQEEQEGRCGDPARESKEDGSSTASSGTAAGQERRRRRRERASSGDDWTHGMRR